MESMLEKRKEYHGLAVEIMGINPGMQKAIVSGMDAAYKDGALPEYVKRLMALVGALVHGCEGCQLAQALRALDAGATADQVVEACNVAMSLGGTMAVAESVKILALLKEKGLK